MAKVKIVNAMFYGFHGTYEYEREQGQKFYLDVEVTTKDEAAAESDDDRDTVNSATIYSVVKDAVENKRFKLLRALGVHIGDSILEHCKDVAEVKTVIRKPSVPISGPIDYVQVEIVRTAK